MANPIELPSVSTAKRIPKEALSNNDWLVVWRLVILLVLVVVVESSKVAISPANDADKLSKAPLIAVPMAVPAV